MDGEKQLKSFPESGWKMTKSGRKVEFPDGLGDV
jgi:hypothetical protein